MQADKTKVNRYLNVAKGQLEGIRKLIEDDAYCLDISNQILATIALLKKTNHEIISEHLKTCVHHAKNEHEAEEKLLEIIDVLKRIN